MNARVAGVLYLVNIATSLIAFSGKGSHLSIAASGLAATASYVAVTILLYYLFKPLSVLGLWDANMDSLWTARLQG